MRQSVIRRCLGGACAGALILTPALAQQPAPAASSGVTTVSPLTVLSSLPKVGTGATLFTPDELDAVAAQARAYYQQARDGARECLGQSALSGPLPEDMGEFSVGALSSTEARAQFDLQQRAEAARAATDAALAASVAAARGDISRADLEKAELVRQAATKAFQDARKLADEAHYRTLDLLELADQYVGGDLFSLRALEKGIYVDGCMFDQNGNLVTDVVQPSRCSQRANMRGMREVWAQLDYRSLQRSQGDGRRVSFTPAEYADLRLANVVAGQVQEKGAPVIRVTGKIVNPRRTSITPPPLWVEILDQYGTSLKAEQVVAPRGQGKIPPRDSLTFTYAVSPVPERMAKASVTFAPSHRQTPNLVAAMTCTGE